MLHSVRVLDTQYHKVEQVLDIYYTQDALRLSKRLPEGSLGLTNFVMKFGIISKCTYSMEAADVQQMGQVAVHPNIVK